MVPMRRYRPRMRRWLALGVACASVTISGCSSRAGAERLPPPPVVSVVEARRMTVPIMAEPIGTTRALQEVSIRARVRGFLKEIHFREGADVKKGQLLFVIDEEPFKAKLAEAQATLEEAEAALKKARDSKAREVAAAQLALGQSMLALAEVEERREQLLLKRNAATVEDVQRKQALRQKDAAQVEADKASLEQAKADYETNIIAAQANVAGAKARVVDAQIDLSYCRMFVADRRPDRPGRGQAGQPRRPGDRGRRLRLHRAGGRPAARPDGRRHPGRLPLPRPGDAADRAGAPGRGLPARPRG